MRAFFRTLPLLSLLACNLGLTVYDTSPKAGGDGGDDGGGSDGGTTDTGLSGDGGDGGSGSGGSGGGSGGGGSDPAVDSVTPGIGPASGGLTVLIEGSDFGSSPRVFFGSAEADIESASSTSITVTSPPGSSATVVDVIVRNGSDEGTLSGGYEYTEDASGMGGGLGYVEWFDAVGFLGTSWTDWGFAAMLLPTSTNMHYWDLFSSSSDTCQSEFSATLDFDYVHTFEVASLSLRSGGTSLSLPLDSSTLWFDAGELSTSIPASTSFNLVFPAGSGFDEFAVTGMVVMPSSAPTVSTPNLSSSSPPNISTTQVFNWSPSGGDKALIMLQLYDASGSSVRETVTCVVNDDGSFSVPSGTFRLWQRGNPMAIYVGRVEESTAILPWNGGQSRIAGVLWTVGQGTAN